MFTAEEDALLVELVASGRCRTWRAVASHIPDRTARQCRDRWANYLSPAVSAPSWTPEEDALIVSLVGTLGTRWAAIAAHLPGRSDTAVKNRWYLTLRPRTVESVPENGNEVREVPHRQVVEEEPANGAVGDTDPFAILLSILESPSEGAIGYGGFLGYQL
jgi:hypothetical protein